MHLVRYMQTCNEDKSKMKFQSFVNFTKNINHNEKLFVYFIFFICCVHAFPFWASPFMIRPYNIFLVTSIMFKHFKLGNILSTCFKSLKEKNKKNKKTHAHCKILYQDEVLKHLFAFFHPGMKLRRYIFEKEFTYSQDEISHRNETSSISFRDET